jgi:hypothetical protein
VTGGGGGVKDGKGGKENAGQVGKQEYAPWLHLVVSVFGASPGMVGVVVVNCDSSTLLSKV